MSETLIRSDRGPVRVLTLNRPEARNALSRDLIRALYAALKESDLDEAVGAVVLTGADPAFCAGLDLKEAARDGMDYFAEFQTNSCIAAVAEMLFESVMREDRNVVDLLNADYTFVNERLARHYGIPNVYGSRLRAIAVFEFSPRFQDSRWYLI